MSAENALAISREQTRALLMRSLYRANVRQKEVARRRTTIRYVARVIRWCVTALLAAAGLLWGSMELELAPQWRIVTVDQMRATAPSVGEKSAADAGSPPIATADQVQPDQGNLTGTEDQAAPIQLKSESQLKSQIQ